MKDFSSLPPSHPKPLLPRVQGILISDFPSYSVSNHKIRTLYLENLQFPRGLQILTLSKNRFGRKIFIEVFGQEKFIEYQLYDS